MSKYPPMSLDDKFRFGSYGPSAYYPGAPLWRVLENDHKYVRWLLENMDGFSIDNEAYEELERRESMENKY